MGKKVIKVTIPTNQSEITLKQYQDWIKFAEEQESEFEIRTKLIEIMCGMPKMAVLKMKKVDFDNTVGHLLSILQAKQSRIDTLHINGQEFGLIPKMDDISLGEFMDIDSYITKWETVHLALNVLYRPVKSKHRGRYLIEDYSGKFNDNIYDLPLSAVNGVMLFFYHLSNDLLKITPNYLARTASRIPRQQREHFGKNGDGIRRYIVSLNLTIAQLRKRLHLNYFPNSHSWPLKKTNSEPTKKV